MYKLYYAPRNASWAPHLVLNDLGVDYELVLVDRKSNQQKSEEYLKLNPTGRIPTLVHDELVIFESAAICLYLCEQHPHSELVPKTSDPNRVKFHQWLFYLTSTLQSELMLYFYPEKHTTDSEMASSIVEAQTARVIEILGLLDTELESKQYLVGDTLTVCDYFLFMLSYWAGGLKKPPLSFDNLGPYLQNLAEHQVVKDVCKAEGISLKAYTAST